ncbi:MAG: PIN domain-containing protein [Akkermansiaceae bacterium]|nr:PIN domain-containing protein [Akkermansiaceae bacterium]
MRVFPDTSLLCALYRRQVNSPEAIAFMERHAAALPVSGLLLLEFRQSVRLQTRLFSLDRRKGFPESEGARMLRDLQSDLTDGILKIEGVDWAVVYRIAETLSSAHTRGSGNRLVDILHVATALHLGAEEFLTFDANQKALAESEGMSVPFQAFGRK